MRVKELLSTSLPSIELRDVVARGPIGQHVHTLTTASKLMTAIMDAFTAHGTMSRQALDSERVRAELKDVLLGPAQLYEALRDRGEAS